MKPLRNIQIGIQAEPIRNIFSNRSKLFWSNPKNILNLIQFKSIENQSGSIPFNLRFRVEWIQIKIPIWIKPNESNLGLI